MHRLKIAVTGEAGGAAGVRSDIRRIATDDVTAEYTVCLHPESAHMVDAGIIDIPADHVTVLDRTVLHAKAAAGTDVDGPIWVRGSLTGEYPR